LPRPFLASDPSANLVGANPVLSPSADAGALCGAQVKRLSAEEQSDALQARRMRAAGSTARVPCACVPQELNRG
jgi:hypothetical protein